MMVKPLCGETVLDYTASGAPSSCWVLRYVQVSAGADHALGLLSDGTVLGWVRTAHIATPPPLSPGVSGCDDPCWVFVVDAAVVGWLDRRMGD